MTAHNAFKRRKRREAEENRSGAGAKRIKTFKTAGSSFQHCDSTPASPRSLRLFAFCRRRGRVVNGTWSRARYGLNGHLVTWTRVRIQTFIFFFRRVVCRRLMALKCDRSSFEVFSMFGLSPCLTKDFQTWDMEP